MSEGKFILITVSSPFVWLLSFLCLSRCCFLSPHLPLSHWVFPILWLQALRACSSSFLWRCLCCFPGNSCQPVLLQTMMVCVYMFVWGERERDAEAERIPNVREEGIYETERETCLQQKLSRKGRWVGNIFNRANVPQSQHFSSTES